MSCKPAPAIAGQTYLLEEQIAAIPAVLELSGTFSLDAICKLPKGRDIKICGEGFSSATVRVLSEANCYFVFADDLKRAAKLLPEQSRIAANDCKQCSISGARRPSGLSTFVYPEDTAEKRFL